MSPSNRVLAAIVAVALAVSPATFTVVASAYEQAPAPAAAPPPEVPVGFQDVETITGLSEPTAVAFAPDGTAFIALKTGIIKTFEYDPATEQFTQTQHFAN